VQLLRQLRQSIRGCQSTLTWTNSAGEVVAGYAERRGVFVFRQDEIGDDGVVGFVAGEASNGRGVLAKSDVGARDRMSVDGVIELVSFVEV
jgi:hypothetical protein